MLSPTTFFVVVITLIGSFQIFEQTYMLTQGGPANSTHTLITYLYQTAFPSSQPGPALAMGVVSFAILMGFSLLYLRLAEKEAA